MAFPESVTRSMKNIRMEIGYDGTRFSGWQRQQGAVLTVQGTIEPLLGKILQEHITIVGAGRTDKGVHARGQTASFMTASAMNTGRLMHSLNSLLPPDIRVTALRQVPDSFHARFSAKSREYRYLLLEEPSALDVRFSGCCYGRPDILVMKRLSSMLSGELDFSAFLKEDRDQEGTLCTIHHARWYRSGRFYVFRIVANRFLRSMVRYLVSAMVETGMGRFDEDGFRGMLSGGSRPPSLTPANPAGLFLWKVQYR